jgi:anti-sigma B factor antagonist
LTDLDRIVVRDGLARRRGRAAMPIADRPLVEVSLTREDAAAPVISLAGELDLASVEATKSGIESYLATRPNRVTFDLEKLTFMDSSGIALLVEVANDVGKVTLIHVTPIVYRILEASGLLEHFGLQ